MEEDILEDGANGFVVPFTINHLGMFYQPAEARRED